jgi:hypothetical protein
MFPLTVSTSNLAGLPPTSTDPLTDSRSIAPVTPMTEIEALTDSTDSETPSGTRIVSSVSTFWRPW